MNADELLMMIITQPHSGGTPNPEKCMANLAYQVPICARKTPDRKQVSVQVDVVVPSRFCKLMDPPPVSLAAYLLRLLTQDIWGEGQEILSRTVG